MRLRRSLVIAGLASLCLVAILVSFLPSDSHDPSHDSGNHSEQTKNLDSEEQGNPRNEAPSQANATHSEMGMGSPEELTPYVDENGVISSYGERIRFRKVANCSETFIQSKQGEWYATHECGRTELRVEHPYGAYSIEQLEQAANDLKDGDAAYILAERFVIETWRDRRSDANEYFVKAFLLTTDAEIYERMLAEMGIYVSIPRENGAIDSQKLATNYTMARVGQMFGVVDDSHVDTLASVADESTTLDLRALDQEAGAIYASLVSAREGL